MERMTSEQNQTAQQILTSLVDLPEGSWLSPEKAREIFLLMSSETNEEKIDAYLEKLVETAEKIGKKIADTNRDVTKMIIRDNEDFERKNDSENLDGILL